MFRTQCGALAGDAHKFCGSCGHQLGATSPKRLVTGTTMHDVLGSHGGVAHPFPPPTETESEQFRVLAAETKEVKPERFLDVIGYGYKNYAEFGGRATRAEFWKWYLYVVALPVGSVLLLLLFSFFVPPVIGLAPLALLLITIGHIVPTLAYGVRRLHDSGRPGYSILMGFIPLVGNIILLAWLLMPSAVTEDDSSNEAAIGFVDTETLAPESVLDGQDYSLESTTEQNTLNSFVTAGLVFLAVLVVALFFSVVQTSRLVTLIEQSERTQISYAVRYNQIEAEVKVKYGSSTSSEGQAELLRRGSQNAVLSLSAYVEKQDSIRNVTIPFWDFRSKKLRNLYLVHSVAWQGEMNERMMSSSSRSFDPMISSSWKNFCNYVRTEKPLSAFGNIDQRIDNLCKEN